MDSKTIRDSAQGLAKAFQRRWRTAPTQASVTLTQAAGEVTFALPAVGGTRVQLGRGKLHEAPNQNLQDPYGFEDEDHLSEPRFLRMARDELKMRKDLRCKDCGYLGLPSPDYKCPNCGGPMENPRPEVLPNTEPQAPTHEAVRAAVDRMFEGTQREIPTHVEADIHLSDLMTHYGFRSNGDHYTLKGDDGDHSLRVDPDGTWIHHHPHGKHRGKGIQSLKSHLDQHYGKK